MIRDIDGWKGGGGASGAAAAGSRGGKLSNEINILSEKIDFLGLINFKLLSQI